MGYDEFRGEYDKVLNLCLTAKLDLDGLEGAVERLTDLRDQLPTPAEQNKAAADIADLTEILTAARETPYAANPAFTEAARVLSRSTIEAGTTQERIDRARRGIDEIHAVARTIRDPDERDGVLQMVQPLSLLISSLRDS